MRYPVPDQHIVRTDFGCRGNSRLSARILALGRKSGAAYDAEFIDYDQKLVMPNKGSLPIHPGTETEHTPEEASLLKAFLASPDRPEGTLRYHELQGFLFAIGSAPELVSPSVWLPLIFAKGDPVFASKKEADRIVGSIMSLYNGINRDILAERVCLPESCQPRAQVMSNFDEDAPLHQWSHGFACGHTFLADSWEEFTDPEAEENLDMDRMVLTFFCSPQVAEQYRSLYFSEEPSVASLGEKMTKLIPEALSRYASVGRALYEHRLQDRASQSPVTRGPKIGRNEPCPCGSGKKYKNCCGRVH